MTKIFNKNGEQIGFVETSKSSRDYALRVRKRAEALALQHGISLDEARHRVLVELENPIPHARKISKKRKKRIRKEIIARAITKKRKKELQELLHARHVKERAEEEQRRKQQAALREEERKKDATMARRHPLGFMIGETVVTQYKSPGSNLRWATKRRRKP